MLNKTIRSYYVDYSERSFCSILTETFINILVKRYRKKLENRNKITALLKKIYKKFDK